MALSFKSFEDKTEKITEEIKPSKFFREQFIDIEGSDKDGADSITTTLNSNKDRFSIFFGCYAYDNFEKGTLARQGLENAPHAFNKNLKLTGYTATKSDDRLNIFNLFDWIGTNTFQNKPTDFSEKTSLLKKLLEEHNAFTSSLYIGMGGGAQILSEFMNSYGIENSENSVLIKISPRIGGSELVDESELNNRNYMTHFKNNWPNIKVLHLALQNHLCHKSELENTKSESKDCFWLDSIIREVKPEKPSTRKTQFGFFLELVLDF